jgi:ankyrin repeat protein
LTLQVGYTRFRQKIVDEAGNELFDDAVLDCTSPQIIFLPLCSSDVEGKRLLLACQNESGAKVEELLCQAVNPNLSNTEGWTPLHWSVQRSAPESLECTSLLLEAAAMADQAHHVGETPLHLAVAAGHAEVIRLLLESGASLNAPEWVDGQTPLHYASWRGHAECVQVLLEAGAYKDAATTGGKTPLYFAVQRGHVDIVRALIKHGASLDETTMRGATALHEAVSRGNDELACCLVQAQSDVNKARRDGLTALHLAASDGHIQIVRSLLKFKADRHKTTLHTDRTPLQLAQRQGHVVIASFLKDPPEA